jgi:hypothetical protein
MLKSLSLIEMIPKIMYQLRASLTLMVVEAIVAWLISVIQNILEFIMTVLKAKGYGIRKKIG